jgi:hypothetical protein
MEIIKKIGAALHSNTHNSTDGSSGCLQAVRITEDNFQLPLIIIGRWLAQTLYIILF